MKKILRLAAVPALALSLGTGVVSATTGSIDTTGPDSDNEISWEDNSEWKVRNDNNVRVKNYNPQTARTGDARVSRNTTGGDATSGDATNDSLLRARVSVDNSSATSGAGGSGAFDDADATIENTGPDSDNKVKFENNREVDIDNDNWVSVENYNHQYASSGDAKVTRNTTGGNATSGNATNVSTNETTVEITN